MGLPSSIESITLYRQSINGSAIYAEVMPFQTAGDGLRFNARVVDADGKLYLELKDYRTAPLPIPVKADLMEPFKELVKGS